MSSPPYRVDVKHQADVAEEILRIYGYNNIEVKDKLEAAITNSPKPNAEQIQDKISDLLAGAGYTEIMNNSITKANYFEQFNTYDSNKTVKLLNPLSADLNCMRQTLLFGALETVKHNFNHKRQSLKLFEFGKIYQLLGTSKNPKHKACDQDKSGVCLRQMSILAKEHNAEFGILGVPL